MKMNKTRVALLLAFTALLIFTSCSVKSKGYDDLDMLYADFPKNLKTNDQTLKDYCNKITPDEGTISYMKKSHFSYRGLPEGLEKENIKVSVIGEKYYEQVMQFKQDLIANNQLENLQYIGREKKGEELYNKELGIYATETFIILKSGSDTIKCKLGEMFKVDGKWKSFTQPKLGW